MKDPRGTLEFMLRHASHSYPGVRFDVIIGWHTPAPQARFQILRDSGAVAELVPINQQWIDDLRDGIKPATKIADAVFNELDRRFLPASKVKRQRWDVRLAYRVERGWLEVCGDSLWPCTATPMDVIADVAKSRGVDLATCHPVSAIQVGEPE